MLARVVSSRTQAGLELAAGGGGTACGGACPPAIVAAEGTTNAGPKRRNNPNIIVALLVPVRCGPAAMKPTKLVQSVNRLAHHPGLVSARKFHITPRIISPAPANTNTSSGSPYTTQAMSAISGMRMKSIGMTIVASAD